MPVFAFETVQFVW